MYPLIRFLIFTFASSSTAAGFFVWPSDWVVINNSSLPSTTSNYKTMDGPFRAIVAKSGKVIFSQNYTFAFGFIDLNSSGNFILSVAMGVGEESPPAVELWSANRNRPVGENAVLKIGAAGNMVLQDWDGTDVWNSGDGRVKAIEMQEYGDLEFFDTTNASDASSPVWRSWLYPTHTLVQGQALNTGSRLVSNASVGNTTEGMYSLVMEPGGMVLYTGTGSSSQPYWAQGFLGLDYQDIRQPCFDNASSDVATSATVFAGQSLELSYFGTPENASGSCPAVNASVSEVSLTFGSSEESVYRFVRLDDDGNLRSYKMAFVPGQGSTAEWAVDYELFPTGSAGECRLPNVCGRYGVCSNGQCSCPGSGSADAFVQVNSLDAKLGCLPPRPLVCDKGKHSSIDQHFLQLEGVDYFLNSYSTPEPVSTLQECKSLCSSNCSCEAFFFRSDSSSCFQAREVRSLLVAPNNTFKAYLKVQNAPATPTAQASSSALHKGAIAGIAVGAGAAVFLICSLLLFFILRRKHDSPDFMDLDEEEEAAFLEALPGLPPRFSLQELRVATGGFKKKLGAGGFGSVYEGVLKDGSKVAVKRLNGARQGHKEFRAEVATIGSINHVNLVRLRGFCAERGERLLIYELMENGSLDKWIFKDRKEESTEVAEVNRFLSWERRLSVAMGTAKGLAYLHEDCREAVLHLDIKPQNILVDDSFIPKVADFGMARLMERDMTEVVTAVRGTPGYLAPEWLRASIATKKCDVYSFGMVLLELIGGRRNFDPTLGSDPSFFYFPTWAKLRALEGRYMDLLDERIKDAIDLEQQEQELVRVIKVAFWCIHEVARMRPTMGAVVKMLEGHDSIPDLGLGLGLGEESEHTQDASCSLPFSLASISNNQVSGPR